MIAKKYTRKSEPVNEVLEVLLDVRDQHQLGVRVMHLRGDVQIAIVECHPDFGGLGRRLPGQWLTLNKISGGRGRRRLRGARQAVRRAGRVGVPQRAAADARRARRAAGRAGPAARGGEQQ